MGGTLLAGGGGVLPAGLLLAGAGGVLPAGGGGVLPAGGGGVLPAGGGGGFPAGGLAARGGGILPAGGGGTFPPAGGGGVLPAGGGTVFPAGGAVVFPGAVVVAGFAGLFASFGAVLEVAALGSAGLASVAAGCPGVSLTFFGFPKSNTVVSGKICVTIPAAIVFPPSLKANLDPLSIVIGKFNLALIVKLSPGLAILVFYGSWISAAVSAVLK